MATNLFPYTVTYSNGIFEVYEASNGDLLAFYPRDQLVMKTHNTDAVLFFMGTSQNLISLDYTLCTNLTNTTRKLLMDNIVALGGAAPLGAVTISGQPIATTLNQSLGENYGLVTSRSTNGDFFVLRAGATLPSFKLADICGTSSTALSGGTYIKITQGATITGGTWAVSAATPGSKVEVNTGGAVSGGSQAYAMAFNENQRASLIDRGFSFVALETCVISLVQTGIGTSGCSVNWTETP